MIWPPARLTRAFLLRGAFVWLASRLFLAGFAGARDPSLGSAVVLATVAGILGLLEARRRHELHFLGNLGVHGATIVILWIVPVITLEALYAVARLLA